MKTLANYSGRVNKFMVSKESLFYYRSIQRTNLHRGLGVGLCALAAISGSAFASGSDLRPVAMATPSVLAKSKDLGPTNPNQPVHIALSFQLSDPAGAQKLDDDLNNPASPHYGQWITPEEFGQRFGQSPQTVKMAVDYLKSKGFKIQLVAKNNLNILADGTVGEAESAFGAQIDNFQTISGKEPGNQSFFSYKTPISAPFQFSSKVLVITGLETFTKPQRRILDPNQTHVLYNTAPLYNNGIQGQGRNTAISNFDGYRLTNVPLYYAQYNLPTPAGGVGSNITVIPIGGGSGGNAPAGEGDLDIQMVLGMAPLSNFFIYDGVDLVSTLTQEANDNTADVISESYGWNIDGTTETAAHNLHVQMSTQGISYQCASGDSGTSIEPYHYPNNDPDVLMVGGTVATTDTAGDRQSEIGWNGSGGGWTTDPVGFNTLPSWQKGKGVPTGNNHKLSPDVSLNAATDQGAYYFYLNGALTTGYDGTSFACPVFTGGMAIAEQKLLALGELPVNGAGKHRLGRLGDIFYAENQRPDVWYDITVGDTGQLPDGTEAVAGPGWDYVSGWGPINYAGFVNAFGAGSTSTTLNPISAVIYKLQGTSVPGNAVSNLLLVDSIYYQIGSVASPAGQIAGVQITYPFSGSTANVSSLAIKLTMNSNAAVSNFVYVLNNSTGGFDTVGTFPVKTGSATYTLALNVANLANYVKNGQIVIVDRAVKPSRFFSGGGFTLRIDQAVLTEIN